ncbi:MAG TPA: hypothetical protein VE645_19060 [Pseudonocardiaceae bacterium]|jgi:hypothetical protein|nr:hypothetical protein [Pseudonocardiaceae bacterium]
MAARPLTLKHPRPASGLIGWAAAWTQLDHIESDRQREALTRIVRELGVQGALALEFAARQAMWLCGLADYKTPKKALKAHEQQYIERRVIEELRGLDRKLFPRMAKSVHAAPPANNVAPIDRGEAWAT